MNAQHPNKPFAIDQAHLRRARNLARESGCSVITELEYLHTGTSKELVEHLAKLFGMKPVGLQEMQALTPAYDLLPLSLARRWQCLLFRNVSNGVVIGVIADPFDPDLQLWLNSQAHSAVIMCLASTSDLQYYLRGSNGEGIVAAKAHDQHDQMFSQNNLSMQSQDIAGDLLRRVMRY